MNAKTGRYIQYEIATYLEIYTHTVATKLLTVGQGEGSLKSTVSLLLALERIREDGVTNTLQGRGGEGMLSVLANSLRMSFGISLVPRPPPF